MVAFEVVELHFSTLNDKNARAVDSKTFVGNALTAHRQNYSNAFRYFWFGDSHTLELTSPKVDNGVDDGEDDIAMDSKGTTVL